MATSERGGEGLHILIWKKSTALITADIRAVITAVIRALIPTVIRVAITAIISANSC